MDRVPKRSEEIAELVVEEVFGDGPELEPRDARELMDYPGRVGPDPFGPQTSYFVLGSYDPPFKYRLERVEDRLNQRPLAYAYLQVTQPDPDLADWLPTFKLKFYTLAFASDHLVLVLEHNAGGDLLEYDRLTSPPLIGRSHLLIRTGTADGEIPSTNAEVRRRVIGLAYTTSDERELEDKIETLAAEVDTSLDVDADALWEWIDGQLGGHQPINYTGLIPDVWELLRRRERLSTWALIDDLDMAVAQLP